MTSAGSIEVELITDTYVVNKVFSDATAFFWISSLINFISATKAITLKISTSKQQAASVSC